MDYKQDLTAWRRQYLIAALEDHSYKVAPTAAAVGLPRRTLYQYLHELGIALIRPQNANYEKSAESCNEAES